MKEDERNLYKKELNKLLPSYLVSELGDSITSNEEEDTVIPFSESSESYQLVSFNFFIYNIINKFRIKNQINQTELYPKYKKKKTLMIVI